MKRKSERQRRGRPNAYNSPACSLHEIDSGMFTIYHNPSCSKSRATLELLRESGVPLRVVEYLKTPPNAAELAFIVDKLGMKPADLVRKGEAVFKERFAGRELSDAHWLAAMAQHPILIERPIVVTDTTAVIGRPPENVRSLLPGSGS